MLLVITNKYYSNILLAYPITLEQGNHVLAIIFLYLPSERPFSYKILRHLITRAFGDQIQVSSINICSNDNSGSSRPDPRLGLQSQGHDGGASRMGLASKTLLPRKLNGAEANVFGDLGPPPLLILTRIVNQYLIQSRSPSAPNWKSTVCENQSCQSDTAWF